jgi:hypothetical protein
MNDADTPNRWFQAWRSQPRTVPLDPADLGTAFGLDASFDAPHGAAHPSPNPVKPGWMQRLTSRGKRPT